MPATRIISNAIFERGPRDPLAISVSPVRQGGHDGYDLRLADDANNTVVRIVGTRVQLGPSDGLVGHGHANVDSHELPLLESLSRTWRDGRVVWPAHVLGCRRRFPAYRFRPGSWTPERLGDPDDWEKGETSYRVAAPAKGATFGPLPVELALENALGECVGVVLRTPSERCLVLARGSFVISTKWPEENAGFGKVARLLVSATTDTADTTVDHMRGAAEFDHFGAYVLEEAATVAMRKGG